MRLNSARLQWPLMLLWLLGACQTVGGAGSPGDNDWQMRRSLQISAENLPGLPIYRPVAACEYSNDYISPATGNTKRMLSLRIVPVASAPGRLLITMQFADGASTAVISRDGELHDFNLLNVDGSRYTRDNYAQRTREEAIRSNAPGQIINSFEVAFPRFEQSYWRPGHEVARVRAENGGSWGVLVYRGLAGHSSWPAAVLDIVRSSPSGSGASVGFSIVDIGTMTPLLTVVEGNRHRWRLQRISCS